MLNPRGSRLSLTMTAVLLSALVWMPPVVASGNDGQTPSWNDAVGSWFGRAVAVPGGTICPPGSPGCPVPAEFVMVFTINKDGTFIGSDSNIFAGGDHTTAHGQWERSESRSIKGAYTFLQSSPAGVFIGGFKNLFDATVVNPDELEGRLEAFLYSYTTPTGVAILGADGLPTPSPLSLPSQCATQAGCTRLGEFAFRVKRVKTP